MGLPFKKGLTDPSSGVSYQDRPFARAKQRRGPGRSSSPAIAISTTRASPMSQKAAVESAEELSESIWNARRNDMTLANGSKAKATAEYRSK